MQGTGEGGVAGCAPRQRPAEIQAYYRDPAVVADYLARRTAQPRLNRLRRRGLAAVARGMIGLLEHLPSRAPSTWMLLAEVAP